MQFLGTDDAPRKRTVSSAPIAVSATPVRAGTRGQAPGLPLLYSATISPSDSTDLYAAVNRMPPRK